MSTWQRYTEWKQSCSPLMRTFLQMSEAIIIIVVVLVLFSAFGGDSGGTVTFEDSVLLLSHGDDLSVEIDCTELQAVSLADMPDSFGTCLDGAEGRSTAYGTWNSDEWGEYVLCVKTSLSQVIVLSNGEETVVFNYESDEVTSELYEYILQLAAGE